MLYARLRQRLFEDFEIEMRGHQQAGESPHIDKNFYSKSPRQGKKLIKRPDGMACRENFYFFLHRAFAEHTIVL